MIEDERGCPHDMGHWSWCSICNGAEQRYRDAEKEMQQGPPKPQPPLVATSLARGDTALPLAAYENLPNESARWDIAYWRLPQRSKYHPERLQGASLPRPGGGLIGGK